MYVENGDAVSLSRAKGKIVMVNGRVSGDVYQRLVSAGAVGFISVEGSPLDEGVDRVPCQRSLPTIFPGMQQKRQKDCRSLQRIFTRYRKNIVAGFRGRIFIIRMQWSW